MTLARLDSTLAAMLQRPFFTRESGALLRTPDGNAETFASDVGSDLGWLALNVGDGHSWNDWTRTRENAQIECLPWKRCRTVEDCLGLIDVADSFGCPRAILNLEDELKDVLPPAKVAALIENDPYEGEIALSLPGWLYNDVDYAPLAHLPALLQLFPQDMHLTPSMLPSVQADCCRHAREKGFTYVGITVQTYGDAEPEWYGYMNDGTRSFYTGDDIGAGNWARWRP